MPRSKVKLKFDAGGGWLRLMGCSASGEEGAKVNTRKEHTTITPDQAQGKAKLEAVRVNQLCKGMHLSVSVEVLVLVFEQS
jgi:hypothetical protein